MSTHTSTRHASITAALAAAIVLFVSPALAQEAPPVNTTHDDTGLLPEPEFMTTAIDFAGRYNRKGRDGEGKDGVYPSFGSFYTGSGWLSVGAGYRLHVFDGAAVIDGSGAVSWRGYTQLQGRFEMPLLAGGHLSAGTQTTWQDLLQVNYFGIGPDSLEANRSEYRIKTIDIIGYAAYRPVRWLSVAGRAGWLNRPTLSSPTGPNDRDYPDARETFASDPAFTLDRQPAYVHGDLGVTVDTRDYPSHPMSGALYRGAWTMYSDRRLHTYTFHRYEAEGLQVIPLLPERVTLLAHAWTVASDTSGDKQIPVYMLPSLGGSSTLRSFSDFRFHDRNLLVASVESRVALFTHVDVAAFADAGNVAPRFSDLDLAKRSYGIGLRVHTHESTLVRADLAKGSEGWRLTFSLNDPFRLKRIAKPALAVPFVP